MIPITFWVMGSFLKLNGSVDDAVLDFQHQHRVFKRSGLGNPVPEHLPARFGRLQFGVVGKGGVDEPGKVFGGPWPLQP